MLKSTIVNEYGFDSFANGGYQSPLQSTSMGSNPLLMVDFKVYNYSQRLWVQPFAIGRCQSLLQSTKKDSHPLLNGGYQSLLQKVQ